MTKDIAVLPGDGIGPEITDAAVEVLRAVERRFGHQFNVSYAPMGGAAVDTEGTPLPEDTLRLCKASEAVLFGAIGGPKWDNLPSDLRPEKGLLNLRKNMGLYANLRPARLIPALKAASPLRASIVNAGINFLVVRELTGGVYYGSHTTEEINGVPVATDVMQYTLPEIERILHIAFKLAMQRRKKLTSVDKANVLDTSRLWRRTAESIAKEYPDVAFENMLVDNAAMQIVKNPAQFDVIVTENMFGDILTDEASMITGSIGNIPSASLSYSGPGLYEPIHGSAPDIAGKNIANPVGTILSAALMLRYSLGMQSEAEAIERAVDNAIAKGMRTADTAVEGEKVVSCSEAGEIVGAAVMQI